MRLRRLYSNKDDIFRAIEFNDGFSAVIAEIRLPANRLLDTHNLGKTTVGELLDFCLLRGKDSKFFLFKHEALFHDFIFYLTLELEDSTFLTIARPVSPGSRISFKRSDQYLRDVSVVDNLEWDHVGVPIGRAKLILDGLLNIAVLKPWPFRKLVGYLVRSQRDYFDVYQLNKFKGRHGDWKPFVAQLVGMDSRPVDNFYRKRNELEVASARLETLSEDWSGAGADVSVLDGLISVKRRDVEEASKTLESFNFQRDDGSAVVDVAEDIEVSIAALLEESYRLTQLKQRLSESLEEEQILFHPAEAEALFRQAGVYFADQLKRTYEQLVEFNHSITRERREALTLQLESVTRRLAVIDEELGQLNVRRARALAFVRETDSLVKFKDLSQRLTRLQADLSTLESRREAAVRLAELRRQQRVLAEEYGQLETAVEAEAEAVSHDQSSRFATLRGHFTDIISEVLGQDAIVALRTNASGGLEFVAEFVGESGTATSGDQGTSYRKLLCIAFDLAMLRAYLDVPFPRFVYHDGALEQLELRKREKLIGVLREYAALGLQPVISALDGDLPAPVDSSVETVQSSEVILVLHDEGDAGRLFRMDAW